MPLVHLYQPYSTDRPLMAMPTCRTHVTIRFDWAIFVQLRPTEGLDITTNERDVDDDSYDEVDEHYRNEDSDEDDHDYFPVEESKPPNC